MTTTYAIMSEVNVETAKVSIKFKIKGSQQPAYHVFHTSLMGEYYKLWFILNTTKVKKLDDIKDKSLRVIYDEEEANSIIAVGDPLDDKFVDLQTQELHPVSEKRIYRRYREKV